MTLQRVAIRLCLVAMLLYSVFAVVRAVLNTSDMSGARDLHTVWYSGHFIRQGSNPYRAFLTNENPSVPVKYLDGVTIETLPITQAGLSYTAPAYTAPIMLLLSVFSWVSWPLAKTLWLLVNLILMFVTPWLLIRLLPDGDTLGITQKLLICFAFYGFVGTRVCVGVGQVALLVFVLMLGALLTMSKNWFASGIMLGFALSKYSVALPVFLFMLYERRYRAIATSLILQVAGLLSISLLSGDSPISLVWDYVRMLQLHISSPGIHLASLFPYGGALTPIVFTLIVWGLLGLWLLRSIKRETQVSSISLERLCVLTILTLWALLVAYHRVYDTLMAILFVVLVIYGLEKPEDWRLSRRQRVFLTIFIAWSIVSMSLPGTIVDLFLPQSIVLDWVHIHDNVITVTLMLMLTISLWLLYQTYGTDKLKAVPPSL